MRNKVNVTELVKYSQDLNLGAKFILLNTRLSLSSLVFRILIRRRISKKLMQTCSRNREFYFITASLPKWLNQANSHLTHFKVKITMLFKQDHLVFRGSSIKEIWFWISILPLTIWPWARYLSQSQSPHL